MTKKVDEAVDVILDKINQICGKFGLNNIMAQLYAILYFSNKPLSLDEMMDRLKISKASVSINIRNLERYNAVRKVWVKGTRKDYYEAETDIRKVAFDRVRSMFSGRLNEVNDMIDSSEHTLNGIQNSPDKNAEDLKVFKERLQKIIELRDTANFVLNLVNSGNMSAMFSSGKTGEENKNRKA